MRVGRAHVVFEEELKDSSVLFTLQREAAS